jgi:hypothetical protein
MILARTAGKSRFLSDCPGIADSHQSAINNLEQLPKKYLAADSRPASRRVNVLFE